MRSRRQTEEDALRLFRLLDYPLPQTIKDELQARLVKIKNGEDPYKGEDE